MSNPGAIEVWIQPRSHTNAVEGMREDAVVIRLTAPPVDGEANRALVKFVAQRLGVSLSPVAVLGGECSRHKWIAVEGLSAEGLRRNLLAAGRSSA